MDINDLKKQREELAQKARAIMTTAETAGRDMTSDEEQAFDRHMEAVDKKDKTIEREEKLRDIERGNADRDDEGRDRGKPGAKDGDTDTDADRAFRAYLIGGLRNVDPALARALNASSDPEGGYLVAPTQFVQGIIQRVDDQVFLRQRATVYQLTESASLGVPTLDTDLADAEWTSEIGTGSQDDNLRLGRRELTPNPLAKRVKMSRKLLRLTAGRAETLVMDRMAYKFGVTGEKAYMTGNGNKQPLGLFTASTAGISTGRDVAIGAAGAIPLTAGTADQLIDAKYTLKAQYWSKAEWLWHRDMVKTVRKLKSTDGQYLWKPGLSDQPDTVLELPFIVSEYAPNTVATGQYAGMIGDFSKYWIADALSMEVQRLSELYAETNQTGFIGRMESDGMPAIEEAFVRLKIA